MKKRIKKSKVSFKIGGLFATLALVFFSTNVQAQCLGTDVIQNPEEFQWTYHPISATNPEAYYSGTMEVGEVTLNLNNGETFTTRAYRQQGSTYNVPGPTIKVVPGNKYILSLHNTLPYEVLSTSHNVYKDPNAVNIHTHGLHISGESPSDDVTRVFEGGRGGDFVWDIPADHMGGTYWYHAHHHGATTLQVSGGMLGMLVVDDSNDNIPLTVSGMEERELLFAKIDPTAAGKGGDDLMGGSLSSATWTTNGIVGGNICMPANTWQHWRVLVADPMAMLRDVEFGPECEVMVLARDGVWRTVAPKDLTTNKLQLTGASRADFAVRTTGNSTISVGGMVMANIHVEGTPDATVHPFDVDGVSTWSANRPSYLRDLRTETNVNNESMSMGARTVNGSKYDHHNPTLTLPTTQVQEWSISGNVRHPFHLHVYHVQALEDDRDFEAGEFYDVMASQMSVRFDLNQNTTTPYGGRTIMHCHILEHEDQGAMGWLNVNGGTGAPTFPADADLATPYSDYYVIPTGPAIPNAANGLLANAISTSEIDLSWTDNSSDEDGFNIERSTDGTNFVFIGSVNSDVTVYNDNGLSASTLYYYRITAYNAVGSAAPSNVANATTLSPPVAPDAPTNLTATAISSSSIDLNWSDNSSNEDGFNIERSADGINFSLLATVGVNSSSYNDNGLTASTTYYYRVIAYNSIGNSAESNIANATTENPPQIPSAPTSLIATATSSSSIDLDWSDNSSDEDGFNIERSSDGTNFNALASVGSNVSSYSDNGLTASTIYYYRVSAYNVAGSSTASNLANATTDAGAPEIHVENIVVIREALNGNRFRGVATVTIFDATGTAVSNATVDGNFSGTSSSSESGSTDSNGQVTFNSGNVRNPSGEWCFEVTGVSHSGSTYNSGSNVVTIACESGPAAREENNDPENSLVKDSKEEISKIEEEIALTYVTSVNVFPNPFQDGTRISFELSKQSDVLIEIYSIQGKKVAEIANGTFQSGQHLLDWNTQNLETGTYFLQLRSGNQLISTKRLMMMQ